METFKVVLFLLAIVTSLACTVLLFRSYVQSRVRLLLWSSVCFVCLTANNVILFVDVVVLPVEVTTGASFSVGTPRVLFKFPSSPGFDVSPDGQRFLFIGEAENSSTKAIEVVVDWFSNLGRATPARSARP